MFGRGKKKNEGKSGQPDVEDTERDELDELIDQLKNSDIDEDEWEALDISEDPYLSRFPEHVREALAKEYHEMEYMDGGEKARIRRYLDWVENLPWEKEAFHHIDLGQARAILDKMHYGLHDVKDRILEFLAVQELTEGSYGSVLLLVGPPGVGKTSFAKSIAEAMQRKFVKISLGGVFDEMIIRGCDRSYTGSQPGNITRALRQCGVTNPVMLLDEIDKVGQAGHSGDVNAALLEMLDSERSAFHDHYLGIPLDLSGVLFIATANDSRNISPILLDRLHTIEIDGYTIDEKMAITREYILPEEEQRHGLKKGFVIMEDEPLLELIQDYASEPGMRSVQHHIQTICSRIAYMVVTNQAGESMTINRSMLHTIIGHNNRSSLPLSSRPEIGVANAMGYLSEGQGVVFPLEVGILPGDGDTQYTGNLRKTIRESCEVAISIMRSCAAKWGIDPLFHEKLDLHFHALFAGIPKDGPSMGVALFTALYSALAGVPIRNDLAMTGEITLRGKVMPIGGLDEKITAAYNAGLLTVIIPEGNRGDLAELPEKLNENMKIIPVKDVEEILNYALAAS